MMCSFLRLSTGLLAILFVAVSSTHIQAAPAVAEKPTLHQLAVVEQTAIPDGSSAFTDSELWFAEVHGFAPDNIEVAVEPFSAEAVSAEAGVVTTVAVKSIPQMLIPSGPAVAERATRPTFETESIVQQAPQPPAIAEKPTVGTQQSMPAVAEASPTRHRVEVAEVKSVDGGVQETSTRWKLVRFVGDVISPLLTPRTWMIARLLTIE